MGKFGRLLPSNEREVRGATAQRVIRKVEAAHPDLCVNEVYQNTRRLSRFNDEEAWSGWGMSGGKQVELFSWETLTSLAQAGSLTITPDEDGRLEVHRA